MSLISRVKDLRVSVKLGKVFGSNVKNLTSQVKDEVALAKLVSKPLKTHSKPSVFTLQYSFGKF